MTTLLASPRGRRTKRRDRHTTIFNGIPYAAYEAFLDALGERPVRVNYDDGAMEIMTISREQDAAKSRIGGLIEDLAIGLGVEAAPCGSTTFRSRKLRRGLEPDECYYVANEARIRSKKQIDLGRDPPPDLVLEIDISYHEIDREAIYAAMGVPELWKYDGERLTFWKLDDREWSAIDRSLSFPQVRPADLEKFVRMVPRRGEMAMRKSFRDWVQNVLTKRK